MLSIKELLTLPQSSDYYRRFSRDGSDIKVDRIDLIVLCGQERNILETAVNGDSTIVLMYKGKEGVLFSLNTITESLGITQLQGCNNRAGYRLTREMYLVKLFADQTESIVNNDKTNYKRICMPRIEMIEGLIESDSAIAFGRYKSLTSILGMSYSNEERLFVRDIKRN